MYRDPCIVDNVVIVKCPGIHMLPGLYTDSEPYGSPSSLLSWHKSDYHSTDECGGCDQ